jgi:hypothetical protein
MAVDTLAGRGGTAAAFILAVDISAVADISAACILVVDISAVAGISAACILVVDISEVAGISAACILVVDISEVAGISAACISVVDICALLAVADISTADRGSVRLHRGASMDTVLSPSITPTSAAEPCFIPAEAHHSQAEALAQGSAACATH